GIDVFDLVGEQAAFRYRHEKALPARLRHRGPVESRFFQQQFALGGVDPGARALEDETVLQRLTNGLIEIDRLRGHRQAPHGQQGKNHRYADEAPPRPPCPRWFACSHAIGTWRHDAPPVYEPSMNRST